MWTLITTFFGKRDLIYLLIIGALLVGGKLANSHYKSELAEKEIEKADLITEKANLSNRLSEATRKLEIEETNYKQCKAAKAGLDAWVEDYQKGAAIGREACEGQLKNCMEAHPAVPVNAKDGIRGARYEDGKASTRRVRDMLQQPTDGVSVKTSNP